MFLGSLLNRKWILTTILVFAAVVVMIRLGLWQLDRLEQRRTFNARVTAQRENAKLKLTPDSMNQDLYEMEYRALEVTGEYAHSQEVALSNQVWNGMLGVHLLTPMKIKGTETYVLIDRGWIPQEDYSPDDWSIYQVPGQITVEGVMRRPQSESTFGGIPDPTLAPGQTRLAYWKIVNLARIQAESGLSMLPIYIKLTPKGEQTNPPLISEFDLELKEGPHMGYALQWFAFAAIMVIGYPVYVRAQSLAEETESFNK